MTVDEVVAANVRHMRKDKKKTIAELAQLLDVGEHVVRDYERPRRGQPQRAFTWEEIVRLCDALEVTLFELVLPAEGVTITDPPVFNLFTLKPPFRGDIAEAEAAGLVDWLEADGRSRLGWVLFGITDPALLGPKTVEMFAKSRSDEANRITEIFRNLTTETFMRLEQEILDQVSKATGDFEEES